MPDREHAPTHSPSPRAPAHDDHTPVHAPVRPPARKDHEHAGDAAFNATSRTIYAAGDILKNASKRLLESGAHPALWRLYYAVTGNVEGERVDGTQRLAMLDEALRELASELAAYAAYSGDYAQWAVTNVEKPAAELRESIKFQQAQERVDGATLVRGKVLEVNASLDEQAAVLHGGIPKLAKDLATVNEWVTRFGGEELAKQAHEMMEGHAGHASVGSLVELQSLLLFVDGFLTLGDPEFREELQHNTRLRAWATRAEFIKAVTEIAVGGALVATSLIATLARVTGSIPIATMASGAARHFGEHFSKAITAIEVVHDLIVLLDPRSSRQQRLDAGAGAASGSAYLAGSTPVSFAILMGYEELKLVLNTYWQTAVSVNAGLMLPALEALQRDGVALAGAADRVAKAGILAAQEKDHEQAQTLNKVLDVDFRYLSAALDGLISDCAPTGAEAGVAKHPGAYSLIREIFAPVTPYRGAKDHDTILAGTKLAIARVTFTLSHAGDVIVASTKNQHLPELERSLTPAVKERGES